MNLNRIKDAMQDWLWRKEQNENLDMIEQENELRKLDIIQLSNRIKNLVLSTSNLNEVIEARGGREYLNDRLDEMEAAAEGLTEYIEEENAFDYSTIAPIFHTILAPAERTIIQSPVWDEETGQIFASQVNGLTDVEESFTISRLTSNGSLIDFMQFKNGGHGTVFGLERENGKLYIWTSYLVVDATGKTTDHKLARAEYTGGKTINSVAEVTTYDKFNTEYTSVCTDPKNGLIAFRKSGTSANDVIELRKLSDIKAGVNKVLASITIPSDLMYLQGMALDGYTLYWRTGDSNSATYPDEITMFDFNTGTIKKRITCSFGKNEKGVYEDNFREPEGIFLYTDPKTSKKTLFATVITGAAGKRINKIYAYHQKGNAEKFASILTEGAQSGETGAKSRAKGVPDGITLISKLDEPDADYYMTTAESNNFDDHPDSGDAGWHVKNTPYDSDRGKIQFMLRNSVGRAVKILVRGVSKDESVGEWAEIPTGQALMWKDVPLQSGATNADPDDKLQCAVSGSNLFIRGRVNIPTTDGVTFAQLPTSIAKPSKNWYQGCVLGGTTGDRKIVVRTNGELAALGMIANEPENITYTYVTIVVPIG